MMRSTQHRTTINAMILGLWIACLTAPCSAAPSQELWTPINILSEQNAYANHPTIAGDSTGRVHLLWVQKVDSNSQCTWDAIVYSFEKDGSWSAPVDVLISPNQRCALEPALAIDYSNDKLHLVWGDLYYIYYSSADGNMANTARAWSTPLRLEAENAKWPDIVVDSTGSIHVAYCRTSPGMQVVYVKSDDGGQSWTPPQVIHTAPAEHRVESAEVAVDDSDRIHLVWTYELQATGMSRGGMVLYTQSTDAGTTWMEPMIVDQKDDRYREDYGAGEMAVTTAGANQVHLVWAGSPAGHRWHQWSSDGGTTWHSAQLVAPLDVYDGAGLRFFNRGLDLAVDSLGRVHLLSSGVALAHVVWDGTRWLPIEDLVPFNPVGPRMAITNGNELYVTGAYLGPQSGQETEVPIWEMHATTNAPFVVPAEPRAWPTVTVSPQITPTKALGGSVEIATSAVTPTPIAAAFGGAYGDQPQQSNAQLALVIGVLASGSLVVLIIGAQLWTRRGRR